MRDAPALNATTHAAAELPGAAPATDVAGRRGGPSLARAALVVIAPILAWIGWNAAVGAFSPRSGFGYALGVAGGTAMAMLLLYPLRKRLRLLRSWVPLKHWLAMHVVFGIAGPLLVVFHSTFRLRSLNATVAMACMVLVAASGLVGRFIYRRIHRGMDGAGATLDEAQAVFAAELARLESAVGPVPEIGRELDRFAALGALPGRGRGARALHFLTLGLRRARAHRRIGMALARVRSRGRPLSGGELESVAHASRKSLIAVQRVAQYVAYERLFSLWRILHVPLVYMLVISAVVHVVAVHAY